MYVSVKLPMPIVTIMINYKYLHTYVRINFRLEFHAGRQATQQNHAYNTVCNGCRKIASFLWVYGTVHSLYRYLV